MEPTLTTTSTPSPTPSVLDRLRRLFGRRPADGRPIVVMCASGMGSRTAAKHLRGLGFEAAGLTGGIGAWLRAGGSVR